MRISLVCLSCLILGLDARAVVTVNPLFSDRAVLQRDMPVRVWGTAEPGEQVTVKYAGQQQTATADTGGKWVVTLKAMKASAEPREMVVESRGTDEVSRIKDVLVGDVWLAGGQSNMAFPLSSAHNATGELAQANDPCLRFFSVAKKTAAEPQPTCVGHWEVATPISAKRFSAVAYFFAREIRRDQEVPVAVIQAPWGGTDIETWISLEGLKQSQPLVRPLQRWEKAVAEHAKIVANPGRVGDYERDLKRWQEEVKPGYDLQLKQYNSDKADGKTVGAAPQPSRPEPDNPDPLGSPSPSRRPSTPTVLFNGMISPLVPYTLRGVIWYQGENNGGRGLEYRDLFPRLIGDWRARWQAAGGAAFPFLFVQLPCNGKDTMPVATNGWPWLREAQAMTLKVPETGMAVTIDVGDPNNVHPADKLDVGQRLARVARKIVYQENVVAAGPVYRRMEIQGAKVRVQFEEIGGGLVIGQQPWCAPGVQSFPKDTLIGFFLAGEDRTWFEAVATIDGDSVALSSPHVVNPVAVRYGWANSPRCNLYNREGLPASPFRTDDWPAGAAPAAPHGSVFPH